MIKVAGYVGLFAIVFAESGLFFGFFLPGDTLLFTAGFLASQSFLNIWLATILVFVAAVIGDSVGYAFGKKVGPALFNKENSRFFNKEHLKTAERFYEKNGASAIIMARFLPVIRTFAPIVAGAGKMHYAKFIRYNMIGGFIWTYSLMFAGYFLGKQVPNADTYLLPIILAILIIANIPSAMHLLKNKIRLTK